LTASSTQLTNPAADSVGVGAGLLARKILAALNVF